MAVLAVVGLLLEWGLFRRLRDNLRMQVIASLGLILVIQNGVIAIWGPNALQMRGRPDRDSRGPPWGTSASRCSTS